MTSRQVQKLSCGSPRRLGEPGHGALERMRMQVRHARHDPATEALRGLGVHIAPDLEQGAGEIAPVIDLEADVPLPAVGQPRVFGMEKVDCSWPHSSWQCRDYRC